MALDALRSTFRRQPAPVAADREWPDASETVDLSSSFPSSSAPYAEPAAPTGPTAPSWNVPAVSDIFPTAAQQPASAYEPGQFRPLAGDEPERGAERRILDVPVRRAATLSGAGAVGGVLVTLLLVNLLAPAGAATAGAATGDAAGSIAPGSGLVGAPVEIPAGAAAALRGTTQLNARLGAQAAPLAKALGAKTFKTGTVVKILRSMAGDARAGAGMVQTLGEWPAAATHGAALASFYEDLERQIDTGLAASVKSTSAYKKAAKRILGTLESAPALDADARALAATGALELPPVTFPSVLR